MRVLIESSAERRLDAAREFLAGFPPATEVVVVSANRGAADDFVRSFAAMRGATFGLHRFSLTQLAFRIAVGKLATEQLTPITPLAAQAIAAHVSYSLRTAGRMPYFSPVARYPGFAPSLAATLQELRRARIDGSQLHGAAPSEDLGKLLGAYNDELEENAFSDTALLYAMAAEIVTSAPPSLVRAPLLLLDVRADSQSHRELIRALVHASSSVLATLHPADEATSQFFASFNVTPGTTEFVLAPQHPPVSSLERIRANLFSPESLHAAEFDESVVFFSAPGEGREAVEITRAILRHARAGIRFDEMAVFLRRPAKYQAHLEAAFERAAIPACFARGSRRPDPSGRALLALLACAAEQLSAKRFAEYLSLGQVPEAPAESWRPPEHEDAGMSGGFDWNDDRDDANATPSIVDVTDDSSSYGGNLREPYRWESLLVEAAVIGGRERWQRRLKGLDAELRRKLAELTSEEPESPKISVVERQLTRLGHLSEFALPIVTRLDTLNSCRSWREWIDALRELAAITLRRPDRVLEVLAELEPMASITPVGIDEVRVTLAERLSALEIRPPRRRFGRVFVAPIEQAAGRSFKVVFIPGVVERGFPEKVREDPLLLDGPRRAISAMLETSDQRSSDERLRLQSGAATAEEFLYISYPRLDAAQGRSRVASFYALDVIRAVTGRIPDHDELERIANRVVGARLAWPAPVAPDTAIDDLEHDLAVLAPRLTLATKGEQAGRARYLLELNPYLAESLRVRYARWQMTPWLKYDGITKKSEGIRAALEENSLRLRPYSPSALQRYATCPYQFFLSAILRLEPREEVESPVRLDPLTRGLMIHAIHATTLRRLAQRGMLPLNRDGVEAAEAVLHDVVDEIATRWEQDLAPAIPRVWTDEVALIRTDLRLWLRDIAAESDQWKAEACELAFGLPASPDYDAASRRDPVRLPGDWLLRGSVDLVERRVVFGDLRVSDYKTGANRTREGMVIGGGETLQPLLYALAVEQMSGSDVSASRLFFSTSKGGFTKRVVDINPSTQAVINRVLEQIDTAVTSGFLPPAPRVNKRWAACDYCDFITVCGPYEPIRSKRKDPGPLAPLERLRDED